MLPKRSNLVEKPTNANYHNCKLINILMKRIIIYFFIAIIINVAVVAQGHHEVCLNDNDYIPAPKAVHSKVTLGVYIFPGWYRDMGSTQYPYYTHDNDSEWKKAVAKKPKPRALLGFYSDSIPEVNDWHIKWALEHGISFFAFDWYWNAGEKRLSRTLEDGFLNAKYCSQMKFCIHWCNHALDWHNPLDFNRKALLEMTNYLADKYFKLTNYLMVDGRPVFIIWQPMAVVNANGGPDGFKIVLQEMNSILHSKGFKDIYLISMYNETENIRKAGFNAFTGYAYYGADPDSKYEFKSGYSLPYEDFLKHQETSWKSITKTKVLPYMITTGANWDDRPRAREKGRVISGKTPDKFESALKSSLKYIDTKLNLAIIEAWNEWGEGSFIEPDKEWRFGFLDAIRKTYTDAPEEHTDYYPSEKRIRTYSMMDDNELAEASGIENQPYPDPPLSPRTTEITIDEKLPASELLKHWEFNDLSTEGWVSVNVNALKVNNGNLFTVVTGEDPQIINPALAVAVKDVGCIAFRMKISKGALSNGQLFFAKTEEPKWTDFFNFLVETDGKWHIYQIKIKTAKADSESNYQKIRLDIGKTGDNIELDWVRIYR
jgi:hypothetical protein